jgi:hypothetical protein
MAFCSKYGKSRTCGDCVWPAFVPPVFAGGAYMTIVGGTALVELM